MHEPIITLEQLRFAYEASAAGFALSVVAWQVHAGESVALAGPSGSGKTTLLHLLAGLLPVQQGSVQVAGEQLGRLGAAARRRFRRRNIGLVFQDARLIPHLSVEDNLLILAHCGSMLRRIDVGLRQRVRSLANAVGIDGLLPRRADRLSQGEAQRAALARALLYQPQLVLADEPTASLDQANAEQVLTLLRSLSQEAGATLVIASHDPRCLAACDRLVTIDALTGQHSGIA